MDLTKVYKKQSLINVAALCIQAQIPVLLIGLPGRAKSSIIRAIAHALKWQIYVMPVPGKKDPAQVQGMPRIHPDGHVEWASYKHLVELSKAPRCIFMLDDLAEASRDMQSYYLGIIYERRFGDLVLENASMVAAANPERGELQVTGALCNRVVHVLFNFSLLEFADDMAAGFPAPLVPMVSENWKTICLPARRNQVAAFSRTIPDLIKPDGDGAPVEQKGAFPSFRTLDFLAHVLAAYDASILEGKPLDDKLAFKLLAEGCIGQTTAALFFEWLKQEPLPAPRELINNPKRVLADTEALTNRPDRLWVILSSLTRWVILQNDPVVWEKAWKVLGYVAENGKASFGANFARVLFQDANRPEGSDDPKELAEYSDVIASGSSV